MFSSGTSHKLFCKGSQRHLLMKKAEMLMVKVFGRVHAAIIRRAMELVAWDPSLVAAETTSKEKDTYKKKLENIKFLQQGKDTRYYLDCIYSGRKSIRKIQDEM